ncbi:MAG: hypothetical protein EBX49_02700 [Synechococcaceae bacterium WB8_1B_136]|nr:hypothetical protein [Synechococcaceae bacterium WB8_1B_136]
MADAPYVIVLALLSQQGERAMPLQGQSLREPLPADADPGALGRDQALELLGRIWQRSEQAPLQRAAGDHSLLVVTLPMEALQEQLPALKARWIRSGDTAELLQELQSLASGVWCLLQEHRQPMAYRRLV